MATKRDNGAGTIYKRGDRSWGGRVYIGLDSNGKKKFKYFSGKSEAEVKRKIKDFTKTDSFDFGKKVSLEEYLRYWQTNCKYKTIKDSSYVAIDRTIKNQIIPYIGYIQLQKVTSDDIRELLMDLKERGYSYSIVKKAYDCLNGVFKHAAIQDDILKNPMLSVTMLAQSDFKKKEIRFFTEKECSLIIEESSRRYQTGSPVYIYGDAYVLMLHTGIRLGEAIGLKKTDWDQDNKTIHIQRNIQSVTNIDRNGVCTQGKQLISNTTKTYSGDRIIPLNNAATEAIVRLCGQHPESEYIICSSNGDVIPPERLERTFYRMLRNIGIEKTGVHSLRHTFASMLFAKKIDIKTISHLLGHASITITLNTYVHLINDPEHKAVAELDNFF